jgi:hypothetical protein
MPPLAEVFPDFATQSSAVGQDLGPDARKEMPNTDSAEENQKGALTQMQLESVPSSHVEPMYFLKNPGPSRRSNSKDDVEELLTRHARHEGLVESLFGAEAGKKLSANRLAEALLTAGQYDRALPFLQKNLDALKHCENSKQVTAEKQTVIRNITESLERTSGEKAARDFYFKEMKQSLLEEKERKLYEDLSRGKSPSYIDVADLAVLLKSSSDPLSQGKFEWLRKVPIAVLIDGDRSLAMNPTEDAETQEAASKFLDANLEAGFKDAINKPESAVAEEPTEQKENEGSARLIAAQAILQTVSPLADDASSLDFPPLPHELENANLPPSENQPQPGESQPADHKAIATDITQYFGKQHPFVLLEMQKAADEAKVEGNQLAYDDLIAQIRAAKSLAPKEHVYLNEALMLHGGDSSAEFAKALALAADEFAEGGDLAMARKIGFATVGMLESTATKTEDYTVIIGLHNVLIRFADRWKDPSAVEYHKRKVKEWQDLAARQ